jgi:putative SOS response-associated peptidase YedK
MCGGFAIFRDLKELSNRFGVQAPDFAFEPRYNARPSQSLPVVLNLEPYRISLARWGIAAPWNPKQLIINTRKDSLDSKAMFKKSFHERRCMILADSFYEWSATDEKKIPFRLSLAGDEPFAMAGIWLEVKAPALPVFTIITTDPNRMVSAIHNRMPAVLPLKHEKDWLNPDMNEKQLLEMLQPFPDTQMRETRVSPLLNSAKNEGPELIKPYSEPQKMF